MERNTIFYINTSNLCLICLKDCETDCVRESRRLCRILTRYFGVDMMVPELVLQLQRKGISVPSPSSESFQGTRERVQFSLCENCSALTNTLNELFLELELVQMKLDQYGQNLSNIITCAGKVPDRRSLLNDRLPLSLDKPQRIGRLIMERVRKEMSRKCSRRPKKNVPQIVMLPALKVALEREPLLLQKAISLLNSPSHQSHFPYQYSSIYPDTKEDDDLALLGCTLSLWIVLLLALLDVDQLTPVKNNKSKLNAINNALSIIIPPPEPQEIVTNRKSKNKMHSPPDIKPVLINHSMNLRKRKIKTEIDNQNQVDIVRKRSLRSFAQASMSLTDESTDEVSEDDIKREEIVSLSKRENSTRERQRTSRRYSIYEVQRSSLITPEQATNAVKAIQIPSSSQMKTVQVKEECEVQLCFSGVMEDHLFQSSEKPELPVIKSDITQTCLNSDYEQEIIVDVPPVAIDFVELGGDKDNELLSDSTLLHTITFPIAERVPTGYTCYVCHAHFESRAKIEKHRAVVHRLVNYVECPRCFHMFSSYFHLELHRKNEQNCRIDESMKQQEMMDIARPLFPFEARITGSIFCPFTDCCEVFESEKKLNLHLKAHGSFQCRFGCCKMFGKAHELAAHEITSHQYVVPPSNSYSKCPRCDYKSEQEDAYITHFLNEHLNKALEI